jgi:AcrR family transcriptional regulator
MAEIKELAWSQIATSGAAALSLRAIAREMGMTSSALYRYFESRDQLLDELACDGFASLADHLEAAESADGPAAPTSFLRIARAYREWCLAHPIQYGLMFMSPQAQVDPNDGQAQAQMKRGVAVLFRCMGSGLADGSVAPPPLEGASGRRLRAKLNKWKAVSPPGLTTASLAACMFVWTQLHGAISLELFGHLPDVLLPADELFEHLMEQTLHAIGGRDT